MDEPARRYAMRKKMHVRCSGGFTYLGLIIFIAIIGIASAASLQVGSILERRAAEEELLDVGAAFVDALASYSVATPAGQPLAMPQSLEDLLKDPRYPNTVRHLRKIYVDPITGNPEWGIVTMPSPGGVGIVGVYSLSGAAPIKVGNFDARFQDFQGKSSYLDWKFLAVPGSAAAVPAKVAPAATAATVQTPVPGATQSGQSPRKN